MFVWSIVFRVLLAVSLILNGSGFAVASAHMHMDHAASERSIAQPNVHPVATAQPPCGEHPQGSGSMAAGDPPGDATTNAASLMPEQESPDCCKSAACRCACVHQAQAAVPVVAFHAAAIERVSGVRPMKSGHASPAIPHLIRPPIG